MWELNKKIFQILISIEAILKTSEIKKVRTLQLLVFCRSIMIKEVIELTVSLIKINMTW